MTPPVLDRPALLFADGAAVGSLAAAAERLGGGRVTLEERLNVALHGLRTNGSTECPVCHASMTPATPHAVAGGAGCGGCGSRLS